MSARSLEDPIEDEIDVEDRGMMVSRVKKEVYSMNKYILVNTEQRNILLCGRTRSGKTTAIRVLKNPCYQPEKDTIFSETFEAKFSSFALSNKVATPDSSGSGDAQEEKYTVNVIDTPGLFEVKAATDDQKARTNEQIQGIISKCLEHEITGVHAVILFASFETGINPEDLAALETFLEMFGGSGVRIGLCITRADRHNATWRRERQKEIMQHEKLKEMITRENIEVLFLGCVEATGAAVQLTEDQLWNAYRNVYQMRKQVLEFIFDAKTRVPLTQMGVAKNKIASLSSKARQCIAHIRYLLAATDHTTQAAEQALIDLELSGKDVRESRAYMTIPEMTEFTTDLDTLTRQIRDSGALPDAIANRVLASLGFPARQAAASSSS